MNINPNSSAFPLNTSGGLTFHGMDIRTVMAKDFMAALLTACDEGELWTNVANEAVACADALIARLNQTDS